MSLTAIIYDANGVTTPDAYTLRLDSETDLKSVIGTDLNLDSTTTVTDATPQGQFMVTTVASRLELISAVSWFLAQLDLDTTEGIWQDSLAKIYGLTRIAARKTSVRVICRGLTGITIPAGSTIQDINGNLYDSVANGLIPAGGAVVIEFQSQETGEIECPIGAINTTANDSAIYTNIYGWDSAENEEAGVVGRPEETQQEFAVRMRESVQKNSGGTLGAMVGRVLSVPGVTDVFARANFSTLPLVLTGVTIPVHYTYLAVVGGTDQSVIDAIGSAVCGCGFIGNTEGWFIDTTSVTATNTNIQYPVAFERPASLPIYFKITVQTSNTLPAQSTNIIQNAVVDTFNGLVDGIDRARIGSQILASDYYFNISAQISGIRVLDIGVGITANPTATILSVPVNKVPTILTANVAVVYQ